MTSTDQTKTYVRMAQSSDIAEWLRMRRALWPECPDMQHQVEISEILANPARMTCLVAVRSEDLLAGFLEVSLHSEAPGCETHPVGYLEGWYVDPDLRRSGVGHAMVTAAEEWAIQLGICEMASDCLIDNLTSLSAHLALGYQEAERLIHFYKKL